MKILHIITGLGNGGAEGMLYRICKDQKNIKNLDIRIISLSDNDWYKSRLNKIGIKVYKINLKKNIINIFEIIKLIKLLIFLKPNVIQTWMYHANLIGGVLGYIFTKGEIFWNIRHTQLRIGYSKILTIFISYCLSPISYLIPSKIIYCSSKSRKVHEKKFYDLRKSILMPNGYDDTFYPSKKLRFKFRKKNKIFKSNFVIGLAARFHAEKNFNNLIKAFKLFSKNQTNGILFLKGKNVNLKNTILNNYLLGVSKKKYRLDHYSSNMNDFMNGIDLFVLPSLSESFPNVLAEAMLCKTPCVSTDVGSAKTIISSTGGIIVPTNNSYALYKAIKKFYEVYKIKKNWNTVKNNSRKRIIKNYNIRDISLKYLKLWKVKNTCN
jgi:glycosyltransferase involved in cell wall biosynthesis